MVPQCERGLSVQMPAVVVAAASKPTLFCPFMSY